MEYFKFGRRYFKTSGLILDGYGHSNGLSPLRNQYDPSTDRRLYTPPDYTSMPFISIQSEPTQFIQLVNQQIEHNYEQL